MTAAIHLHEALNVFEQSYMPPEVVDHAAESEGFRAKLYKCPAGKDTIGYGTNIDVGISEGEAALLLGYRLAMAAKALQNNLPQWFEYPSHVRFVLTDMAYNMGVGGLLKFKNMIAAIDAGDFSRAADEMVDSLWYRQVGNRGRKLEAIMRQGSL